MRLALDLGGTNIRIARVEGGKCLDKLSVPCPAKEEASVVLRRLSQLIADMMTPEVEGIGIGVPSIVDAERGIVYDVANISSWKEVHLKDTLEAEFHVRVAVNNDSNCFALGESLHGEGRTYADMVGVTVGTGIGAGIIIGRRLYGGRHTGAGEIGFLPYRDSDFEHYCSTPFFLCHDTTGAEAAYRALRGDESALRLWKEFGTHFGCLMKAVLYAYAPQAVVLGGGIAASFPLFREAMEEEMRDYPYKAILEGVSVTASACKDSSLLGAAALLDTATT